MIITIIVVSHIRNIPLISYYINYTGQRGFVALDIKIISCNFMPTIYETMNDFGILALVFKKLRRHPESYW